MVIDDNGLFIHFFLDLNLLNYLSVEVVDQPSIGQSVVMEHA